MLHINSTMETDLLEPAMVTILIRMALHNYRNPIVWLTVIDDLIRRMYHMC